MNNKFSGFANQDCDRKEELVTYLYDEATATERASFERHLKECEACNAELNAFGRVRDELSTWQVGFAPHAEFVPPQSKIGALFGLLNLFPLWARSLALAGAVLAVLLVALSVVGTRVSINHGEFSVSFGKAASAETGGNVAAASGPSQQQVESLVKNAVAAERERIQQDYQAQFASFKQQLDREHKARLQAVSAEHRVQLEATKASLKQEIRKANLQRSSIRSFFALDDDRQDPWSDVR